LGLLKLFKVNFCLFFVLFTPLVLFANALTLDDIKPVLDEIIIVTRSESTDKSLVGYFDPQKPKKAIFEVTG